MFFIWYRRRRPLALPLLCIVAVVLLPGWSWALKGTVVVIPAGKDTSFEPVALVAQAVATRLQERAKDPTMVRLGYPSPALPPPPRRAQRAAAQKLKRAHDAYAMMEYEQAEKILKEAIRLNKDLLKSGLKPDGYLESLHLLAATYLLQGKEDDAFKAMNDAAVYAPQPPNKKKFNPTVQQFFERVMAEPPAKGTVRLKSTPGALVWFNGKLRGAAPGSFTLRGGIYLVQLFRPGSRLFQRWIRLHPGQKRTITIELVGGGQAEKSSLRDLRQETQKSKPGPEVSQTLLNFMVNEAIILTGGSACSGQRCPIQLRWARNGRWYQQREAVFEGDAKSTAATLLGEDRVAAQQQAGAAQQSTTAAFAQTEGQICMMDSQCPFNTHCTNGRCSKSTSVTRTWWFWALVGTAVAGAAVAIAIPLTAPDPPVIEVR